MKPKVSICIPTYRQVDFLRQTLFSIKEQKFTDYEIIVSDDSPDDAVKSLLSEFNFGKKLHYFFNETPLGSPANWNAATRRGNGEYIKILHHDDKFAHPDALGEFVNMLDTNQNADFGFCASSVEDFKTKLKRENRPTADQLQMLSSVPEKLFLGNFIGAPSATICRRKSLIDYDNRMMWLVDIDFYIRILQQNKHFSYNPNVLISTPTNVDHQVTELCKNNAQVELYEYSVLFLKNANFFSSENDVMSFFFMRIGKYGIDELRNVISDKKTEPDAKQLLESMLRTYRKRPFLRMIHFLFWKFPLPAFIGLDLQRYIKSVARRILSVTY